MLAKNPRINVTFEEETARLLSYFAHQQHKSVSSLVRDLALEALDLHEDFYLSKLAKKLDRKNAKTYKHEDAWK